MKVLLLFFYLPYNICTAQNVGIGTTNPLSTLDVKGNFRFGGLSSFIRYDSSTGRIEWQSSNLYVPVSQFLIKHSAAGDGLYYNNTNPTSGQLEYRNAAGNPVFFTNFTNGRGYFSGDVGIGTVNPGSRLHVRYGSSGYNGTLHNLGATVEGDNNTYFSLLTPGTRESGVLFGNPVDIAHGGIVYNHPFTTNGLQFRTGGNATKMVITANGEVGIGTATPAYKLHINEGSLRAEGWNSNAATISMSSVGKFEVDAPFSPGGRFLIQENGHTGIGVTNPAYRLDVSGRMRIRSGGNNSNSAGLWLNNNSNIEAAFVGIVDDTNVGFLANSIAGWRFSMNTQTGALKVNASEGTPGQILTSSGSQAASWKTAGAIIQSVYKYPTYHGEGDLSPGSTSVFNQLTNLLSVSTKSRLIISASVEGSTGFCSNCNNAVANISVRINGVVHPFGGGAIRLMVRDSNGYEGATLSNFFVDVLPGSHQVEIIATHITGPTMSLYSNYSTILILPID